MAYKQDRPTFTRHLAHLPQAFLLKASVSHCQYLVHQQNLRLQVRGHGESQPHAHAAGVALHRRIDELLHAGEVHDLVELAVDFGFGHAQDRAVEVDVFPSSQLLMKASAHFEQAGDATVELDASAGGVGDSARGF